MSALSQKGAAVSSTHLKVCDWLAFRTFCDMDTSWPGMGWVWAAATTLNSNKFPLLGTCSIFNVET